MQGLWKLWPATGTHRNVKWSSRCCFCLMARVETLGPSEHETNVYSQWKHPTRQIHFCIQPSRSLANLGSNCDAGLQRSFKPHLFYLFAFLSLLPFSDLFVSKSGLASPVFAPRQNPTGRFSSSRTPLQAPETSGVLHCSELSLRSISHRGHHKAKRRQRKDVAVSQKAGFVPHYIGCGRTFISMHPIYRS